MIVAELGTVYAANDYANRTRIILEHAKAASWCGADAVKVQMFVPDEPLFCPMPGDDARWEWWSKTHLPMGMWRDILAMCRETFHIELFASAFQEMAIGWCNQLNFPYQKVATRAYGKYPVDKVRSGCPLIVSGAKPWPGPERHYLEKRLFCVPKYPVSLSEARWPRLKYEVDEDECVMSFASYDGLSDHSGTPWPSLDALARGAEIIEVHFALDKDMAGPDKPVCLGPEQLKLICDFRNALKEMRGC